MRWFVSKGFFPLCSFICFSLLSLSFFSFSLFLFVVLKVEVEGISLFGQILTVNKTDTPPEFSSSLSVRKTVRGKNKLAAMWLDFKTE